MKKVKINKTGILVLFACIVTAFSFLKSSAVSSQKNEVRTNPNKEYQITYELNGGQFTGEYPKTFKISQETSIPNPIKDGSEFLGWTINDKTDVSPVKDYKIPSMIQGDVKLTANWKSRGNMLYKGESFRSTINYIISRANPSNYKKIVFDYGKPKANGSDVSVSQNKSIIAYGEGDTVYIVSEEEIFANENCFKMFENFNYIESIEFNNFNTSKVTSMSSMFIRCVELESIKGIETFDTSNVTSADFTFFSCVKLKTLDVSNWDTSKLKTTYSMFRDCSILQSLDLIKWNINNVTNMSYMFASSNSLKEIKGIEKWDTSQVTDMSWMFHMCYNLDGEITIMNPNLRDYRAMFWACSNAKNSNSKFIVKYISPETKEIAKKIVADKMEQDRVFLYEEPSTLVDGQTFNKTLREMSGFYYVREIRFLKEKPNGGTDLSLAKDNSILGNIRNNILYISSENEIYANPNCRYMFDFFGASSIANPINIAMESIIFENFNTSQVADMRGMFRFCDKMKSIDVSRFDTSQVTDMGYMFDSCTSLQNIDVSGFNTSQVADMRGMFDSCKNITNIIGTEKWDTSQVTDMSYMFHFGYKLTDINVSNWNISNVNNTFFMFYSCHLLNNIDTSKWDTSNITNMGGMFTNCGNLSGEITITNPNISSYNGMFYDCSIYNDTKFIVKYIDDATKEVARQMVATKNSGTTVGNVFLYEETTVNDIPSNEEPSVPDTVVLTIKDGNTTTIKEILAGEIGSLNIPSKEGMVFSGYFYDKEFTKPVSERDVISEDTTIYIKWEESPQVEENPQEENKDETLEVA